MTQLHFIPVDLGSPIVHCSLADPYVVIMTAEGVVTMFVLKIDSYMGKTHRLALQKPQISTVSAAAGTNPRYGSLGFCVYNLNAPLLHLSA